MTLANACINTSADAVVLLYNHITKIQV